MAVQHAKTGARGRLTASRGVLVLLATAQALQVGHSGYIYAGFIGGIIGGLIGAGITLSVTRAASNIGAVRKKGKARFALALVGLVGLLLLNPCLIFPGAYQSFKIDTAWMLVMASIAWAVAPDLSMVLAGAITGTGMFAPEVQTDKAQHATQAESKKNKRAAMKTRCEICGMHYNSKGAHYRQHHPDKIKHKVYAVDVPIAAGVIGGNVSEK